MALELRETARDLPQGPAAAHLGGIMTMLTGFRPLVVAMDWMENADCVGRSELFFPIQFERPNIRHDREAKAREICHGCHSVEPCRDFAREHGEYGVWGGENEEERVQAGVRLNAPLGVRQRRLSERLR